MTSHIICLRLVAMAAFGYCDTTEALQADTEQRLCALLIAFPFRCVLRRRELFCAVLPHSLFARGRWLVYYY